jgi:two-component system sensor histidine kinase RegB
MSESIPAAERPAATRSDAEDDRPWYLAATPLATLPWLVRLRTTTAGLQVAVVLFAWAFPHLDFPLRRLSLAILAAAAGNACRALYLARTGTVPRLVELLGLAIDAVLLTGLLELTGGPFNPFAVVFVVQIALAALVLGRFPAGLVAALAAICFGLLVYWHTHEVDPVHHRLNDFPTHLFTMWVAAAIVAELVAYFVLQASHALAVRERELASMRHQAERTERLISMTTLAAGAAHELSTPLATIALASRELERAAAARGAPAALAEDARLIRAEVDRCRAILDQMSGRAGGATADDPEPVDIRTIVDDLRARLAPGQASRLRVTVDASVAPVHLPRAGLSQALLSLVKNAFDASGDGGDAPVVVEVTQQRERLCVTVRDRGRGMTPDVLERAGEPFFTTKEPGRGLGLGIFLARIFAERTGGTLTLQSGDGTVARLDLPTRFEAAGAA